MAKINVKKLSEPQIRTLSPSSHSPIICRLFSGHQTGKRSCHGNYYGIDEKRNFVYEEGPRSEKTLMNNFSSRKVGVSEPHSLS